MTILAVSGVQVEVELAKLLVGLCVVDIPALDLLVPHMGLLDTGVLKGEQLLVDTHCLLDDMLHREVSLDLLFIHLELSLFHEVVVESIVP